MLIIGHTDDISTALAAIAKTRHTITTVQLVIGVFLRSHGIDTSIYYEIRYEPHSHRYSGDHRVARLASDFKCDTDLLASRANYRVNITVLLKGQRGKNPIAGADV